MKELHCTLSKIYQILLAYNISNTLGGAIKINQLDKMNELWNHVSDMRIQKVFTQYKILSVQCKKFEIIKTFQIFCISKVNW